MVEFIHHLCPDAQISEGIDVSGCQGTVTDATSILFVSHAQKKPQPFFYPACSKSLLSSFLCLALRCCINLCPSAPSASPPPPPVPQPLPALFFLVCVTQTHIQYTQMHMLSWCHTTNPHPQRKKEYTNAALRKCYTSSCYTFFSWRHIHKHAHKMIPVILEIVDKCWYMFSLEKELRANCQAAGRSLILLPVELWFCTPPM